MGKEDKTKRKAKGQTKEQIVSGAKKELASMDVKTTGKMLKSGAAVTHEAYKRHEASTKDADAKTLGRGVPSVKKYSGPPKTREGTGVPHDVDFKTRELPGGRNNSVLHDDTPPHARPGATSSPRTESMQRHARTFLDAQPGGQIPAHLGQRRAVQESARANYHTAAEGKYSSSMEGPCSTPGCSRTVTGAASCGPKGCNTPLPDVRR